MTCCNTGKRVWIQSAKNEQRYLSMQKSRVPKILVVAGVKEATGAVCACSNMLPVLVVATWSCSGLRENSLLVEVESADQCSVSLSTSQHAAGYIQLLWPEDQFQAHIHLKGWEKPARILFLYGKMWEKKRSHPKVLIIYRDRKRERWSYLVSSLL